MSSLCQASGQATYRGILALSASTTAEVPP